MNINLLLTEIESGAFNNTFSYLYGEENLTSARERYINAVLSFKNKYPDIEEVSLYSAPGRTEVSGNHTDHNHGRVLAASVNLDVIAVAGKTGDNVARVQSEGFDEDIVDFADFIPQYIYLEEGDNVITATGNTEFVSATFYQLNNSDNYLDQNKNVNDIPEEA